MVVGEEVAGGSPRSATSVAAPRFTEPLFVWALQGVFIVLTFVTYSWITAEEAYHVSRGGLGGAASRTLVELNYPAALVAIPILGLCAARLARRPASVLALAGVALCALIPFTVDQDDLDARPINALPALGVAIAVGLTVWALREGGLGFGPHRLAGDRLRIAVAVVAALISIPWLFAALGFYAPDPIYADEIVHEVLASGAEETLHAVHLGNHHGLEGVVLLVTALLLSRVVPGVRGRLAGWISIALAVLLAYGTAIAAEDFWHEQVVKRGAVHWRLPSMTLPSVSWGWLGILVAAAAIELLWFRLERRATPPTPAPR
jgi:hypothetical protein